MSTYTFSFTNDWVFTDTELKASPSSKKGISWDQELDLRKNGIIFYESMAKIFRVPRQAIATGKQLFHRFFIRESFTDHDKYLVAATCLFLSAKAEDHSLAVHNFAEHYISKRKEVTMEFALRYHTVEMIAEAILQKEYAVLHTLAFDLDVAFPHLLLSDKIDSLVALHTHLSVAEKEALTNTMMKNSWSFLNDCSRTPLCLRLKADEIAAGAAYLAGTIDDTVPCTIRTKDGENWEYVLSDNQNGLIDAATMILEVYVSINEATLSPSIVKLLNMFHPYRGMEELEPMPDALTKKASMLDDGVDTDFESDVTTPPADRTLFDDDCGFDGVMNASRKRALEPYGSPPYSPDSPPYSPCTPPYICSTTTSAKRPRCV
ncbi:hypothetical protein DYB37_008674 [Aphanomyces astaci]|uniref:Cyclin N-terminal domain-containing protein n=1 Tax=Aphanomyces astaci TaxID=112090 RepID=A0A397BKG2_APHAT|nr:hypothetical protein AaE_009901 [Aphanomyces astaci]RHX96990.1 hypothetical protein DYB25_007961 [Aphanomyces astaci]RHY21532.1 hypothetical protein DYB36_011809 [Aphanomyces astaci]RHY44320.1 hypothetical protein DYB34_011304 [Aphanomyces astaci]RHY65376.1 hypothetical protein DYB30_011249 [Aphanomyces astaci]